MLPRDSEARRGSSGVGGRGGLGSGRGSEAQGHAGSTGLGGFVAPHRLDRHTSARPPGQGYRPLGTGTGSGSGSGSGSGFGTTESSARAGASSFAPTAPYKRQRTSLSTETDRDPGGNGDDDCSRSPSARLAPRRLAPYALDSYADRESAGSPYHRAAAALVELDSGPRIEGGGGDRDSHRERERDQERDDGESESVSVRDDKGDNKDASRPISSTCTSCRARKTSAWLTARRARWTAADAFFLFLT